LKIICHRGYWKSKGEQNTLESFENAFASGYSVETDIRDMGGELVISHDPPKGDCLDARYLFESYSRWSTSVPLALNIKADGLAQPLGLLLHEYQIEKYFVFDMSIPDTIPYMQKKMNFYSRESEYEVAPAFYDLAAGVWMDSFISNWVTEECIAAHLASGKNVCIVSPELHRRNHIQFWNELGRMGVASSSRLSLCTDFPAEAEALFND
jgi:hypothetical protein